MVPLQCFALSGACAQRWQLWKVVSVRFFPSTANDSPPSHCTAPARAPLQNDVCPLSGGDLDAIEWSLPTSLRIASLECGAGFDPLRIWTTCLVFRSLMVFEEHVVVFKDPGTGRDVTLADRAFAWIREQADLHAPFGAVCCKVMEEAGDFALAWRYYNVGVTSASRKAQAEERGASSGGRERAHAMMIQSLFRGHRTVSVLTQASNIEALYRWQRVFTLVTVLFAMFTIQIWCEQRFEIEHSTCRVVHL